MSTVSLDEFLAPISHALGRKVPPSLVEPCADTHAPLAGDFHDYTTEELSAWFMREAAKMGTVVKQADPTNVADVVLNLVQQFGDGGHIVYADDIGITFACAGIAETATIIQRCSEKSGRSICLLPIGHIALLRKSDLFPYMTQLMDSWEEKVAAGEDMPSNYTFISGPSNTADIELVRVVGVHGPIHAGVVLIDA